MAKQICVYDGCTNYHWAHGVCNNHRFYEEHLEFWGEEAEEYWQFVKKELGIG
jgi:hypothetical protein